MAWLPSYFELALGLNVQNSSLLTLIPYLAMTAMTPVVRVLPYVYSQHVPASQSKIVCEMHLKCDFAA